MVRMPNTLAAVLLCIGFGTTIPMDAEHAASEIRRPTVFAPDDENRGFENAKPPSDLVLTTLLNSSEAKDPETREALTKYDHESLRKLFQAVRVDLSITPEEDYIVLGGGPMTGADNDWFWIVRVHNDKGEILLFTGGLTVKILGQKTNGHYDIEESWAGNSGSVTRVYRYTGSVYKRVSLHREKAKL